MTGGRLPATPINANVALAVDNTLMTAFGRLQGQINAAGVGVYATYALALAAFQSGVCSPNQLIYVTADETLGGVPSWYQASLDAAGLVYDFNFTTQTYQAQGLTLIDQPQEVFVVAYGGTVPTINYPALVFTQRSDGQYNFQVNVP